MTTLLTAKGSSRVSGRPISVGFVGAGNVLWAYLQTLDRLVPTGEAILGGILARNARRRRELAGRRPGVRLFNNLGELLATDLDVVVVITPPDTHAELAHSALSHGKHVLVEKPFAASVAEGRALIALAAREHRWLVSAPFAHLSPTFCFLAERIQRGDIGKVHTARGLYGNSGSHWARWYHQTGGGPLADLGIYNMKTLTAVLGPVQRVIHNETRSGRSRIIAGRRMARTDPDVAQTMLMHRNGATSVIVSSHAIVRYDRPGLEFYGSSGTINLRGDDWDPRGVDIWRERRRCWESYAPIEPTWHWTDGLADLIRALHQARPPVADLAHDLHLVELLAAARESMRTRSAVSVRSGWKGLLRPYAASGNIAHGKSIVHDHTRPTDSQ